MKHYTHVEYAVVYSEPDILLDVSINTATNSTFLLYGDQLQGKKAQ